MTALKSLPGKAGLSLLAACTVCITALFFSAGLVYYTNIHEYSIPFSAFLKGMAGISWPIILVLAIVLLALPKKYAIFQRGIAAMILVAVGAYLYSTFILWHYGVLDGKDIDWSAHWWRGIVDLVVVLAFLLLWYKYWRKLYDYAGRICLCLLVIQFATLASYHFTGDASTRVAQTKYVDTSYSMDFSKKENIIFIVIDTLPYDIFEIALREKKYNDYFKSFVNFTDCAAGFPTTIASIGLMLTGKYYDNSVSLDDYYSSALSSPGSLSEFCRKNDYYITLSSTIARQYNSSFAKYASNTQETYALTGKELMTLAAAALFRSSPHILKRFFVDFTLFATWIPVARDSTLKTPATKNTTPKTSIANNDTPNILIPQNYKNIWDYRFLDKIQNAHFTNHHENPAFNFIHLWGFHPPHYIDENLAYHENRVQPVEQAKACLYLVNLFLDKLRTHDLFDNSTIIITADHTDKYSENSSHIPLLIKPRHAGTEQLKNIDLPVSLADIPSIAIQLAKDPAFDLEKFKSQEKRYYSFYQFGRPRKLQRFLPAMTRYEIRGHANGVDSYVRTGILRPAFGAIPLDQSLHIDFVSNLDNFEHNILDRYEFNETNGIMTQEKQLDLSFSFDKISAPYIKMTYNVEQTDDQKVYVEIRGDKIATGNSFYRTKGTSSPVFFPSVDELWLRFRNIKSLASITFEPCDTDDSPKIEINKKYLLSEDAGYDILVTDDSGFAGMGSGGVWTMGPSASLRIPWQTTPINPIGMDIDITAAMVSSQWRKQRVFAYVGDTLVARKVFTKAKGGRWRIELDPRLFDDHKEWRIRFDVPDHITPKNLDINNDDRALALRFGSVQFFDASDAAFAKELLADENKSTIRMGDEYLLSEEGAYDLLIADGSGFSSRGNRGVMTNGASASLVIPWQTAPVKPVAMVLKLNHVFVNEKVPLQRAFVYAGDTMVASKEFAKNTAHEWVIELDPRHFINDDEWTIRFGLPDSAIPKDLGISADTRSLALRFESVQFLDAADAILAKEPLADEVKPTVTIGTEYLFSEEDAYSLLIADGSGFSSRGNRGVMTDGASASLVIPWQTAPVKPVAMVLKLNHVFVNEKVPLQRAFVYVGDTMVASKEFAKNTAHEWVIELDPRHFNNDNEWTIRFDLPDSVIPKDLGISTDTRSLALRFESVQFLDAVDTVFIEAPPDAPKNFSTLKNKSIAAVND